MNITFEHVYISSTVFWSDAEVLCKDDVNNGVSEPVILYIVFCTRIHTQTIIFISELEYNLGSA